MKRRMNGVECYEGGLRMGEGEYYLEKDEGSGKIGNGFGGDVEKMYELGGFDEGGGKKGVEVVMDVERGVGKGLGWGRELGNGDGN